MEFFLSLLSAIAKFGYPRSILDVISLDIANGIIGLEVGGLIDGVFAEWKLLTRLCAYVLSPFSGPLICCRILCPPRSLPIACPSTT